MIDANANLEHLMTQPHVKAPNLSGGFHRVLFEMMSKWAPSKKALLIAENPDVIPSVKGALGQDWEIECLGYQGKTGETYDIDLNVRQDFEKVYPVVLSQALLEHVCRPSIAIENMISMLEIGGVLVIHTHGPEAGYHAFPVDCVRFMHDFWTDLTKYIPYELLWFGETGPHHFAAMRRIR